MLKPRVTAAQRKQLLDLRTGNHHQRYGGIMIVPGIAPSIEAWEKMAIESQTRLIAETRDDPRYVTPEPAPELTADQERAFAQHVETSKRQRKPMTEEQRAAEAYANAIGLYR